ncbi:MAG: bacteriohemerythrin [Bacteroidales bacterium]|nr:bacteriohemerythrin [Bacteroidales bacterium]
MDSLKRIEWGDVFVLGNETMDKEHEGLVNIHNKLVDIVNTKEGTRKKIAEILSELSDAGLRHFQAEELLMDKEDYPNAMEHKRQHRDFIYNVSLYNVNLMGDNPPKAEEIVNFLHDWLLHHIKNHDTEFEIYLEGQN